MKIERFFLFQNYIDDDSILSADDYKVCAFKVVSNTVSDAIEAWKYEHDDAGVMVEYPAISNIEDIIKQYNVTHVSWPVAKNFEPFPKHKPSQPYCIFIKDGKRMLFVPDDKLFKHLRML